MGGPGRQRRSVGSEDGCGRARRGSGGAGRAGLLIAVGSSGLMGACAHYGKTEGQALESRVYALETRLEAVQADLTELRELQSSQGEQLDAIAKDVGTLNMAARRNDADFGVQLDELLQDVARLKGTTATLESRVSSLESSTTQAQEELDLKLEDLEKRRDGERAEAEASRRRESLLQDPDRALDEARKLIDGGEPERARKLVRALMLEYEQDRGFAERFEPRAQFLVGETYFEAGQFQQAAAEFNQVRKAYPGSVVVPTAYLRLGQCFERLNLIEDAKLFYKTVLKQFPRAPAARQARARLKEIGA
jgi:TolA-binding protein